MVGGSRSEERPQPWAVSSDDRPRQPSFDSSLNETPRPLPETSEQRLTQESSVDVNKTRKRRRTIFSPDVDAISIKRGAAASPRRRRSPPVLPCPLRLETWNPPTIYQYQPSTANSPHIALPTLARQLLRLSKTSCNLLAPCHPNGIQETMKKFRQLKLGIAFGGRESTLPRRNGGRGADHQVGGADETVASFPVQRRRRRVHGDLNIDSDGRHSPFTPFVHRRRLNIMKDSFTSTPTLAELSNCHSLFSRSVSSSEPLLHTRRVLSSYVQMNIVLRTSLFCMTRIGERRIDQP